MVDTWDLEYADDTVLIAMTHIQLRAMLQIVERESAHYNMKLNTGKCELVVQNPPPPNPLAKQMGKDPNIAVTFHFADGTKLTKST